VEDKKMGIIFILSGFALIMLTFVIPLPNIVLVIMLAASMVFNIAGVVKLMRMIRNSENKREN
jgi:flagellar biosynthesis component FlhA